MKHLKEPPPRLADVAPGRSFGALEGVVAQALAKDPDRRFATAHEFSKALAESSGKSPTSSTTDSTVSLDQPPAPVEPKPSTKKATSDTRPRKSGGRIAILGGVLLVLGVGAAFLLGTRSEADPPSSKVTEPVAAVETAPPPAPVEKADAVKDLVERANELASSGRREGAIDLSPRRAKDLCEGRPSPLQPREAVSR